MKRLIIGIVLLTACQPRVPERNCVASHTEVGIEMAMVQGIDLGQPPTPTPRNTITTVCDTTALFDTLGVEIRHSRRSER